MEAVNAFLDLVKVAHPQSHKNLTLFPLLAPETGDRTSSPWRRPLSRPWWKSLSSGSSPGPRKKMTPIHRPLPGGGVLTRLPARARSSGLSC
jgi:hypothetical protein